MKRLKESGLTLVELLIAVVLSAVIIIGITQVFLSNREAFNLTESMARVQENGRFAINVISEAIRTSGNYGCIPWYSSEIGNIQSQVSAELDSFDAVIPKTTDGVGDVNGVNAPDQLELLRLVGDSAPIIAIDYATSEITTEWPLSDISEGDLVLVSNCLVGDYIKAGGNTANSIIEDETKALRTGLYDRIDQQNTATKAERIRFQVNDDKELELVTNRGSVDGVSINGSEDVLVSGVENIQFRYGVDLDDNYVPDYIDDFANIPAEDHEKIIAIEVNVLISSLDSGSSAVNVVSQAQTLDFAGGVFQAPDLRLYRAFQTLVTIRNRVK